MQKSVTKINKKKNKKQPNTIVNKKNLNLKKRKKQGKAFIGKSGR